MRTGAGASSAAPVMEEDARWASQQWTNGQPYIPTMHLLCFKSTPLGQPCILTMRSVLFKHLHGAKHSKTNREILNKRLI